MTAIDSSKPDREVMESVVAHEQIVCDPASNTGRAHTDERDEVFVYPPFTGRTTCFNLTICPQQASEYEPL